MASSGDPRKTQMPQCRPKQIIGGKQESTRGGSTPLTPGVALLSRAFGNLDNPTSKKVHKVHEDAILSTFAGRNGRKFPPPHARLSLVLERMTAHAPEAALSIEKEGLRVPFLPM